MKHGLVYLVGAGPGDAELITMKAVRCLREAEVVVYDRLADPRILDHAPAEAERIYVGKASSQHTMRQGDINQLLVRLAKAGKVVVRLKGGDPYVFGRGGEEVLALVEAGQAFEVVPGITSAIAVPSYAGIPVTHRGVAASFAVVTGHEDPDKTKSSLRWRELATAVDTLIFLMGVENLPYITKQLIDNGRSGDTPAAVIRWGTKPEQRTLVTTVSKAVADVEAAGLTPPAIFIVGDVVRLRESLSWFETRPLFGKRIVVTRARAQASALTGRLERLGAEVLEVPAITITAPDSYEPLDAAIGTLAAYQWLVFTSVNGVDAFFARLHAVGKDTRALATAKIAAIGAETALRLHSYGIEPDIVPFEFRAEGVWKAMEPLVQAGQKVLIPRAEAARDYLPNKLKEAGLDVHVVSAYKTVIDMSERELLVTALKKGETEMITFTSSSTVTNLLSMLGDEADLLKNVKLACIGPVTADTCYKHDLKPTLIADEFTIPGLVEAITAYYKEE